MKPSKMKSILLTSFVVFATLSNMYAQDLNYGLVVHVPFDIDAGDKSSNTYNGQLIGAVIHPDEIIGSGCVYFDGIDDYVEFPRDKVYFTDDYSISIWCKMLTAKTWERILDFNQDCFYT